jgi:uncharacterized protein
LALTTRIIGATSTPAGKLLRHRCARSRRVAALLIAALTVACGGGAPPGDWESEIQGSRAEKDRLFLRASDSPIPPDQRGQWLPLTYFAPDPDYVTPAALAVAAERQTLYMPTSTGKIRMMERVGTLRFTLKGDQLTLGAFIEAGGGLDRLFVPFTDLTNGKDTYEAGRYLDLDRTATGIYVIDFNRAYHPYCYYNPTYDCPFPPPENRLPVGIHAGEKLASNRPAEEQQAGVGH